MDLYINKYIYTYIHIHRSNLIINKIHWSNKIRKTGTVLYDAHGATTATTRRHVSASPPNLWPIEAAARGGSAVSRAFVCKHGNARSTRACERLLAPALKAAARLRVVARIEQVVGRLPHETRWSPNALQLKFRWKKVRRITHRAGRERVPFSVCECIWLATAVSRNVS